MQVNVVRGDGTLFDSLVSPPPTHEVLNYFAENLAAVNNVMGDYNTQFTQNVSALYNKYSSDAAILRAKHMLNAAKGYVEGNEIRYIPLDQWGYMPPVMQNWIMEHPMVSRMNYRNMCNGFGETYINNDPDTYGTDRLGYMNVMSGVVNFDQDGNGYVKRYYFYDDSSERGGDPLSTRSKVDILDVWKNVETLIAKGLDPTSLDLVKL